MTNTSESLERPQPQLLLWADDSPVSCVLTERARRELTHSGLSYSEISVSDGPSLEVFKDKTPDDDTTPGTGMFFRGLDSVAAGIAIAQAMRSQS